MAYTNKTPNFDLPQYVASDKPTYLGDFNTAMSNIDTAMAENKTGVENATNIANNAVTSANGARDTANTAQQTANTAKNTADGLSEAVSTAQTTATNAQASVDAIAKKLNLTTYKDLVATIVSGGGNTTENSLTVATNVDNSLFKIYGQIIINGDAWTTQKVKLTNTGLTVDEEYTIKGIAMTKGATQADFRVLSATVKTDGSIEFNRTMEENTTVRCYFPPCLYFNKNFNDTPIED